MGLQFRWSTSSGCCLILAENLGSAPSCILVDFISISSNTITRNMPDAEQTVCMKFINFRKKPDRDWGSKFVIRYSLHKFNQPRSEPRMAWVLWYKVMGYIRNHKLFISPTRMGHVLWLSIPSCQWSYNHWSRNMWWTQNPLTIKRPRVNSLISYAFSVKPETLKIRVKMC